MNLKQHEFLIILDQPVQLNEIDCGIYVIIAVQYNFNKSEANRRLFQLSSLAKVKFFFE